MNKISKTPFDAVSYLTSDFSATSLGSVVTALVAANESQLAKEMPSIRVVGSGVAATLNLIADAVTYGSEVDRVRLAESLQLMSSLTQFCADATEAVIDADFRKNGGGVCH